MLAKCVPDGNRESSSASIFACDDTGHERRALCFWRVATAQYHTSSPEHHAQLRSRFLNAKGASLAHGWQVTGGRVG